MKKQIALFSLVLAVVLAGCSATAKKPAESLTEAVQTTPEAVILFNTSTIKITLAGAQTTVEDKTNGEQYTFTTSRTYSTTPPTLEQLQNRCIARTSTSTDTLQIELAGGLIVVHDLAGNQTYYINA